MFLTAFYLFLIYIVYQIRARGSRICGHALGLIRPFIVSVLGFKRGTEGPTALANQQLVQKLKPADGAQFPFKVSCSSSGYTVFKSFMCFH